MDEFPPFTQADIAKALRAARTAGWENVHAEITKDGSMLITPNHPDPTPSPTGFVYIIGFASYVKIGYTANLQARIDALQTAIPERLVVYGTILDVDFSDERLLHERFSGYRLEGEWFRKEGELATWIEAGCPK